MAIPELRLECSQGEPKKLISSPYETRRFLNNYWIQEGVYSHD